MNIKTKEIVAQNQKFLSELLDDMRDPPLTEFMRFVFSPQELLGEFMESPASRRNHHAFAGGLAFHTIHAARLGRSISKHYNSIGISVCEDIVVAGILVHDIGKIHCYQRECPNKYKAIKELPDIAKGLVESFGECYCEPQSEYHHVPRASLFHHIPLGYLDIAKLADKFNDSREREEHKLTQKKIDKLLHIILSHHGRKMWSSPVLPQFMEAYIVHSIEMMDGYVEKFDKGEVPMTIYDGTNY